MPGTEVDVTAQSTVQLALPTVQDGETGASADSKRIVFLKGKVTTVNEEHGWLEVVSTVEHTFPAASNWQGPILGYKPWEVEFSGCCRYTTTQGLENDAGRSFLVMSKVAFTNTELTDQIAPPIASPDPRVLPLAFLNFTNSMMVSTPLPTLTPQTPQSGDDYEITWTYCPDMTDVSLDVMLDTTSGRLTWIGTTPKMLHLCVEASYLFDRARTMVVASQVDFMVRGLSMGTDGTTVTILEKMNPTDFIFGYVGYRLNVTVEATKMNSASNLKIGVGYRSRMDLGPGDKTALTLTSMAVNSHTIRATLSAVIPDTTQGWAAYCFYAYEGSNPGSNQQCLDVVLQADTQPSIFTSSDPALQNGLNRYLVAEGQPLVVRVRAFKPPKDDFVVVELRDAPAGAGLTQLTSGHNATYEFTYTAPRNLVGQTVGGCITARGAAGDYRVVEEIEVCIQMEIRRCVYSVRESESLVSISQELGISWLQLWNYNKEGIQRPDFDLRQGDIINVGQLYKVDGGDSLYNIAERFSTSVDMYSIPLCNNLPPGPLILRHQSSQPLSRSLPGPLQLTAVSRCLLTLEHRLGGSISGLSAPRCKGPS